MRTTAISTLAALALSACSTFNTAGPGDCVYEVAQSPVEGGSGPAVRYALYEDGSRSSLEEAVERNCIMVDPSIEGRNPEDDL